MDPSGPEDEKQALEKRTRSRVLNFAIFAMCLIVVPIGDAYGFVAGVVSAVVFGVVGGVIARAYLRRLFAGDADEAARRALGGVCSPRTEKPGFEAIAAGRHQLGPASPL